MGKKCRQCFANPVELSQRLVMFIQKKNSTIFLNFLVCLRLQSGITHSCCLSKIHVLFGFSLRGKKKVIKVIQLLTRYYCISFLGRQKLICKPELSLLRPNDSFGWEPINTDASCSGKRSQNSVHCVGVRQAYIFTEYLQSKLQRQEY